MLTLIILYSVLDIAKQRCCVAIVCWTVFGSLVMALMLFSFLLILLFSLTEQTDTQQGTCPT